LVAVGSKPGANLIVASQVKAPVDALAKLKGTTSVVSLVESGVAPARVGRCGLVDCAPVFTVVGMVALFEKSIAVFSV
jgi:hypothetical protein